MKISAYAAVGVLVLAMAIAGIVFVTKTVSKSFQAQQIIVVLNQRTKAIDAFNATLPHLNGSEISAELHMIDISQCPEDFRSAWEMAIKDGVTFKN